MAYVRIPKDIKVIRSKFMFGLTIRQLVTMAVGLGIALPYYYFLNEDLGTDITLLTMIVLLSPLLFLGFFEKNGLFAETYIKYLVIKKFRRTNKRIKQR